MPVRGSVHSVFSAAANILFNGDFVLSLNAASTPRMPNGIQLSAPRGSFPFSALRTGMPVILGAQRLHIEAIECSLDLSQCALWNCQFQRPAQLDMAILQKNYSRLQMLSEQWFDGQGNQFDPWGRIGCLAHQTTALTLARYLCGRGNGLTPAGDDMVAGWMAAGWLLYGPEPAFIATCQRIVEIARQQTHLLSQCWLSHAASGNLAEPIITLLHALTSADDSQLEATTKAVLAMGATSGYDLIQGMLLASFM